MGALSDAVLRLARAARPPAARPTTALLDAPGVGRRQPRSPGGRPAFVFTLAATTACVIPACNSRDEEHPPQASSPGERRISRIGEASGDANAVAESGAARMGAWSEVQPWPLNPVHIHVLPDGALIAWGINGVDGHENAPGWTDAWTWDPATGAFAHFRQSTTNFFCAGHALLSDGMLLVAGGHLRVEVGTPEVTLFDTRTRTWNTGVARMNDGRWYPTVTALENGDALILGGSIDSLRINDVPQIWTRERRLRDLPAVDFPLPRNSYAWTFLAPNGKVFLAGPDSETRYLSTDTGTWTPVARRVVPDRSYGSAVLYDEGRVLAVGGGDPPTATAEVIDLTAEQPRWRPTRPMSFTRRQLNATLLADGKVLVTGGTSSPGHSDDAGAIREAEIWDPDTETWTAVAGESGDRLYHSSAALLPDGRVVSGGGWATDVQIYSPPYLFQPDGSPAVRPRITGAPDSVRYGKPFFVTSPDADDVERATWIRLSSTTHAFNGNQRLNRLPVERALGPGSVTGVRVTAPASPRLAPPGHYLLFLLNRNGVPSVGRIVWIG